MSEQTITSLRCWACKEPIHTEQLICKECDNWQGWRRIFNWSSLTLSLLVALISVIGAVGPSIVGLLFPGEPDLVIAGKYKSGVKQKGDSYFGQELLTIAATNVGKQPTSLPPALTCVALNDPENMLRFDAVTPTLVEAGKSSTALYKERFIEFSPPSQSEINKHVLDSKTNSYKCNVSRDKIQRVIILNNFNEVTKQAVEFPILVIDKPEGNCSMSNLTDATLESCINTPNK